MVNEKQDNHANRCQRDQQVGLRFCVGCFLVLFVAASLKVPCMKAKHKMSWEILTLIYSFDSVGISSF